MSRSLLSPNCLARLQNAEVAHVAAFDNFKTVSAMYGTARPADAVYHAAHDAYCEAVDALCAARNHAHEEVHYGRLGLASK